MKNAIRMLLLFASSFTAAYAQQTGITGVVTDSQGGLIQGARMVVKQAGGATYNAITNSNGIYSVPNLTAAQYSVKASSASFEDVEKNLLLLVGQLATIDFSLPVSGGTTTAVVQASDELAVDTTSSAVAGNITPSEVQDIPVNGRNYIELSALVPGIKANSFGNTPVASSQLTNAGDAETGKFQITLDGLQISQDSVGSGFGQPHISQDAISQFQIITNRFDATAGRSAGIYVNVQSKTGTNQLHGGAFGYFRNSYFNSSDPIAKKVLDFADQQYGGTLGGAIKRGKLWYFGSYEGEHQPNTATINPIITTTAGGLFSHSALIINHEELGRLDFAASDKNHFFLRGDGYGSSQSFVAGTDPSQSYSSSISSSGYVFDWNRNINDHIVNDFHSGLHYFQFQNLPFYPTGAIQISFGALSVGQPYNEPEVFNQFTQQYRDDLYWMKGKHSFKFGGEYLHTLHGGEFPQFLAGGLVCNNTAGPANTTNLNKLFPKGTLDPSTWDYNAINQFCGSTVYTQAFGNYNINIARNIIGIWAQDDWKIWSRLTLNLGLRYDNDLGAYNTSYVPTPGLLTPNTNPNLNFAPRLGFAYDPAGDGKTSIRGGAGLYFADQVANPIIDEELYSSTARALQATVSGSPGNPLTLPSPFAGQNPSANPNNYVNAPQPVARGSKTPYAFQASFGVQRSVSRKTVLTADLVHMRVYDDFTLLPANVLVNPANLETNLTPTAPMTAALYGQRVCGNGDVELDTVSNLSTGAPGGKHALQVCNNLFSSATRTFTTYPGSGVISDALQVGITHALTRGFTGAVAYTWGRTKNSTNGQFSFPNKPFRSGIQQEWANGTDDQRHTLTVYGDYQWKYGLSLSSLYHFGSGLVFGTYSGQTVNGYVGSLRTFGFGVNNGQSLVSQPIAPGQVCPVAHCTTIYVPLSKVHYDAGYGYWIIQRDGFRGSDYNRVDSRLQESFTIKGRYNAIVAVEAFNLFNHSNYGNFATTATVGSGAFAYGKPIASSGSPFEYQARSLQFIGRFRF